MEEKRLPLFIGCLHASCYEKGIVEEVVKRNLRSITMRMLLNPKYNKIRVTMRRAAVAGAFYEGERTSLEKQLRDCFSGVTREEKGNVLGAVVPHAGYMYSGGVAANVYAKLPIADVDTFVILGPNHQGIAHRYEHSIEVQLPFLQFLRDKPFRLVPICMGLSDEETAREVGEDLADTIAKFDKKVVVIASSDFTHYEPDRIAREKDEYVIEAITELDVAILQ
jgi:predicted class III extradiol MEMO1 family dioxygenase